MQLSGWGQTPACLKEGHTLFLSSRENWKKTGWKCRTEEFLDDSTTSTHNDFMSVHVCYLLIAADAPSNTLQLGVADLPELVLRHRYNSVTLRDQLAAVPNKEAVIS